MAIAIRSILSARRARTPLYLIQAEDYLLDVPPQVSPREASIAVLQHPNMNDTGRLPGIALLQIGMNARLTMTIEAPEFVVDCTGTILGFDLHPTDQLGATEHEVADPAPPRAPASCSGEG